MRLAALRYLRVHLEKADLDSSLNGVLPGGRHEGKTSKEIYHFGKGTIENLFYGNKAETGGK